jgi:sirohydrochlorin ferrochelatase
LILLSATQSSETDLVRGLESEVGVVSRVVRPIILTSALLAARGECQTGLLVVAHGADSGWNARVRETVAQVRWPRGPVALAFLMGNEPAATWDSAMSQLVGTGAVSVVVVPLLVSSHSGHYRDIEAYAGLIEAERSDSMALMVHVNTTVRRAPPVPVRLCAALDSAPELGAALAERWAALDSADRQRPLVLIAHGPNDDAQARQWLADLYTTAVPALRAAGLWKSAWVGLLRDDAAPAVRARAVQEIRDSIAQLALRSRDSVLVFPVLISSGRINEIKIPHDLEGLPVRYLATPLAPLSVLARWVERVASAAQFRR